MPTDKYTNFYFEDSVFPDDPLKTVPVKLNTHIQTLYIPTLKAAMPGISEGLKTLMVAMTHVEGFRPGTRAYDHRNPGNIGNTDSGANKTYPTLADGIKDQAKFLQDIAEGKKKAFPLGKPVNLKPFQSKEIWNNLKNYGVKSGNVPGYKFIYTGELQQFVKIYATLPRLSNSYLSLIISYFAQNGVTITPTSKLADIISDPVVGAEAVGRAAKE